MVDKGGVFMSDQVEIMRPLTWLKGIWLGEGKASFPTHKAYDYANEMKFRYMENAFEQEPLIHLEEIAWVLKDQERKFKHWETGYFKPDGNGSIQLYLCHNTGRIEITYGSFLVVNPKERLFKIEFNSQSIRNDVGTKTALQSRRELSYEDGMLNYTLEMSTSDVPEMTHHLSAEMYKDQ